MNGNGKFDDVMLSKFRLLIDVLGLIDGNASDVQLGVKTK